MADGKKAKTPIEHLFYDALILNSFPFNWLIYYELKKKYKERDSFNAALLLGYLVSWQSTYTKSRKLKRGGYSFRSREYIKYDIGLSRETQKGARDILEAENLIEVKLMPGQSTYYKVKVNYVLKYLGRAKKQFDSRPKNELLPGGKTSTSNDLEINDLSNEEGKGLSPGNQVKAISFNDYVNLYIEATDDPCLAEINENATTAINYFLKKHKATFPPKKHPATWTQKLKPATWENVIDNLFTVFDEEADRLEDMSLKDIRILIDAYFQKKGYDKKCDYSIVHFNQPNVKKILFYENLY